MDVLVGRYWARGAALVAQLRLLPRRNLAIQLSLVLGIATIGVALLQGLLAGTVARRQVEEEIGGRLADLGTHLAETLDRDMFERYREIQILATLAPVRDPHASPKEQRELLETLQRTYPDYAWIGLADYRGLVTASTGQLLEGVNITARPWFQAGKMHPFIGDVHEAKLLAERLPQAIGTPIRFIDIAAPVYRAPGQPPDVIAAHLNWDWARKVGNTILTPAQRYQGISMVVTRADGRVLLGPPDLIDQRLDLPSVTAAQRGESGSVTERWADGETYLVGYQRSSGYRTYPGLGWIVLVRQPVARAFGQASALQWQLTAALLSLGGLSILLGGLLISRAITPLRIIAAASDQLRLGEAAVVLPAVAGENEVARLAHSFRQLIDTRLRQEQHLALANAQLEVEVAAHSHAEREAQRQAIRANTLARIAARLNAQLDLHSVLQAVCEETLAALGVDTVTVRLYNPTTDQFELAAVVGVPLASHDHAQHLHTSLTVPLRRSEHLVGVLASLTALPPSSIDTEARELLYSIAHHATQAISNAAAHDKAQRRLSQMQALRMIDKTITTNHDLTTILEVCVQQVITQLGVDAAIVLRYDNDDDMLQWGAGTGLRTPMPFELKLPAARAFVGRAIREQRRIDVSTLASGPFARWLQSEGFVNYYGVPLIANGALHGTLEVFHRSALTPDSEWLDFLETVAGQIAIAMAHVALFSSLSKANDALLRAYDTTIEGWSRALDLRDKETEGHSKRVTTLTMQLAQALGVPEETMSHMRRGALLHDIGKMGIPDQILLKPGPLNAEEWAIMQRHPTYAYKLLAPIAYLRPALDIPYSHHERWDGSGYPLGLAGEQIPLAARIFAVVDVFDALTHDRPYHYARSTSAALDVIIDGVGRHFDPAVVQAFVELLAGQGITSDGAAQEA